MRSIRFFLKSPIAIKSRSERHILPYKDWPIYLLAFIKTFYQSLFSLALPNYLIYNDLMSADLIGVVLSMTALFYIVTPFIGQVIAKKIGYRNTIIISLLLSLVSYSTQVIIFTTPILILMQLLDGLALGLFWPNLMMQISLWQDLSSETQNDLNFKRFNKSWNFGLLGGFISGYLVVLQFHNDFIALIISVIMALLVIPIGFFVDSASKIEELKEQSASTIEKNSIKIHRPEESLGKESSSQNYIHIIIPAMIAWMLNLGYTTAKSLINFNFPYNLKSAGFGSEWRYIFIFGQQALQIIALNFIGPKSLKKKVRYVKMCLIIDLFMVISLIFVKNIYFIICATIFLGFTTGIKQGFVMKVNFDHSAKTGNSKYINIGEIMAGIGFGITPLWLGALINYTSYIWGYVIYTSMFLPIFIYYFITIRKLGKKVISNES
ncbi:MFS transporter [Candidatus Harpocratesius sp.]